MVKRFNPFPAPKRGVGRMVLKKPVSNKTSSWNKVAYQRHSQGGGCLRVDQTKWRRTIQELIKASDTGIIKILKQDKFLPEWSGAVCPKCEAGVLGTLQQHAGRNGLWHRCNKKTASSTSPLSTCIRSSLQRRVLRGILCKCSQQHFSFAFALSLSVSFIWSLTSITRPSRK